MPAIVQQDHIPAANLFCDFALDDLGRRRIPVVARNIPHDGFEAKFTGHAEYRGPASAERRAEEIGMLADRILQRGAA